MTNKKTIPPRQIALAVALGVAVAATLWAAQIEDDAASETAAVAARKPAARKAPVVQAADALPPSWAPVERAPWPQATRAQLASWAPPPPPAPPRPSSNKPEAPPPPVAPAFPYQLIGRLEEGGVAQALLAGPNRSINARAGDVIDSQWRVEKVGPTGLSLVWLPGQQPQTINFRAS